MSYWSIRAVSYEEEFTLRVGLAKIFARLVEIPSTQTGEFEVLTSRFLCS